MNCKKINEGVSVVGNAKSLVDFGNQLKLKKNINKSKKSNKITRKMQIYRF